MIVDTHLHYSQSHTAQRPHAIAAPPGVAMMPFNEVIDQAVAAGIDRIVQVTASWMGDDNRYGFEGLAARPDMILGVIARVDPFAPDLAERLQRLRQQGILGIRITLHHDWASNWLEDGTLLPFFAELERQGIPVIIFCPNQARALRATVQRFAGLRFVVDHTALMAVAGAPPAQVFAHWADVIELGSEPNVWMKVSYFPEAVGHAEAFPWPGAVQRFREMYDRLGAGRMIWGSNFPPVLGVCSFKQALDFIRTGCDFLSPSDRTAILGQNFLDTFVEQRGIQNSR